MNQVRFQCIRRPFAIRRAASLYVCFLAAAGVSGQVPTRAPSWLPSGAAYDTPFFPGANYDPAVKTPDEILGFKLGTRPATHRELEQCLFEWRGSARMTLHEYARSHEQRALYYAVITTESNHGRLEGVRGSIGKLADPRLLSGDEEAQRIIEDTPAIAWMAYNIHGDEVSSTDAAIAVIYHLVACTDRDVLDLLSNVVVVLDPLMNPDGRDRYLHQLREYGGYTPSLDSSAMQHSGRWPYGRGNHYLFDLNRDWIAGVHPETRGRQRAVAEWQPQLFVDSHEMGAYDTYLFYPPREPFNPYISPIIAEWWQRFADDQAAAFDKHGWSYYTREWVESWYPGYSDAWCLFHGAIGILYEQAGVGGSPLRQPTGKILTYRESVHHHVVSSLANLTTLSDNRRDVLTGFLRQKRDALAVTPSSPEKYFLMVPGANRTRDRAFVALLLNQGVEVSVARDEFTVSAAEDTLREVHKNKRFPAGTIVIPFKQPAGPLVGALLAFDPKMGQVALDKERKSLEKDRSSTIYDVTAWSLPMAYAIDGYWIEESLSARTTSYDGSPLIELRPPLPEDAYGYVIDGTDDASFVALAHLLQNGVKVRIADEKFRLNGVEFAPGSLLIRRHENDADVVRHLLQAARAAGDRAHAIPIKVHPAQSARSRDEGPDLGGGHFTLLHRPRVALFGGSSIDFTSYGAIWRLFDVDVGLAVSLFDLSARFDLDMRRYNVIILPPAWGPPDASYGPMVEELKTWVRAGGTLIAVGNAAEPFMTEDTGMSQVRRRRDVLPKLGEYARAVALERAAVKAKVDVNELWEGRAEAGPAAAGEQTPEEGDAAEVDEWRRVFSPSGAILRAGLDSEHWLTFGCPAEMPVFFAGATALMSKHPVRTPVRLADEKRLRLSGLLWPEAAARIADSAYATVESVGNGQIILFSVQPDLRGFYHGTRRLLINAVLFGPGFGTSPPVPRL
ncbi:MAG: hypothetical protein IH851_01365 [Armatimonadetes bacterium]|nr:hypothetical protein [Armatimonadota bacterium]